jgi:sulfatase maturation enzyme AslB (radical SAM superfamily)
MISFDGEGGNRPFVDGSSSHEMVTSNLRRLAAAGIRFQIRATITRDMVKRETIRELSQFGKSIGREVIMSPASATKNRVLPTGTSRIIRSGSS